MAPKSSSPEGPPEALRDSALPQLSVRDRLDAFVRGARLRSRDWGVRQILLTGSASGAEGALDAPFGEWLGDIDLLCLVERMDRQIHEGLTALAGAGAPALPVETRIGPVGAGGGHAPAIHLVVHDWSSWPTASPAARFLSACLGQSLLGPSLDPLLPGEQEAKDALAADLALLTRSLRRRLLPFRRWRFDPQPRLVRGWSPASSPAEVRKLHLHSAAMLRGWALLAADQPAAAELAAAANAAAAGDSAGAVAGMAALGSRLSKGVSG